MKFIRDIISEKRSVRPAGAEMPAGDSRLDDPVPADRFAALRGPAPRAFSEPDAEAEAKALNLFADEAEAEADLFPEMALDDDAETDDAEADDAEAAGPADLAEAAQDGGDEAEAAATGEAAAEPIPPGREGTLILDTPLREQKPASPYERLMALEAQRREAEAGKAVEPQQLRPAMMGDAAALQPAAPIFAKAEAAQPVRQPSLSEMPFVSARQDDRAPEAAPEAGIQVPPPATGRGSNRSGRVKTRLLGFNPESLGLNPFEKEAARASDPFPVGWLVVVAGPGCGSAFALHDGVSRIGRGEDQTVCLNFGDNSISRENHVSVAYDPEQNGFFIGQSGRSNIVRLNNKPLLSTEQIRSGDQIRVGETTLRLVALCGEGFSWAPSA